jgi:hypothetical protein
MKNLSLKVWYLPFSTDLTTLDPRLWQYLNNTVYHIKPATLLDLLEEITQIGWHLPLTCPSNSALPRC